MARGAGQEDRGEKAGVSATGRSAVRDPSDYYATPSWCVRRLLEAVDLPGGLWLEPCAGEGAIIRAVAEVRDDVRWHAIEYRDECIEALSGLPTVEAAAGGSFQRKSAVGSFAVCLSNPPYRSALEFVQHALRFAPIVIMLLRLNWLASAARAEWMRAHQPSVFVLPDRPSFVGRGGDATDYAWMAWGLRTPGTLVLGSTPLAERRSHTPRTRGQKELFA